jgi:hypothetical protein
MTIIHPGPFLAHLSKVPDGESILTYDGSGEWTKIYTLGLDVNDDGSLHWLASNYEETPGRVRQPCISTLVFLMEGFQLMRSKDGVQNSTANTCW